VKCENPDLIGIGEIRKRVEKMDEMMVANENVYFISTIYNKI
jgi:hypothetical protein